MNEEKVYLTADGLADLEAELGELINVKRPDLARRLRHAIQQGDLSENADYQAAKEEQGFLEGRIQQIEAMLRRAAVIDETAPGDHVELGSRVTVVEEGTDDDEIFMLVGPAEADPVKGKISYESPLGQALRGHRVGDVVSVEAPAGELRFEIVKLG